MSLKRIFGLGLIQSLTLSALLVIPIARYINDFYL